MRVAQRFERIPVDMKTEFVFARMASSLL